MFRTCAFVIGAAAALSASPASAGVLYNTLHSPAVGQISGTGIGNFGPAAPVSFDVPTATTITDIQVLMNTASHDNGTVLIYLVPDDGSGGAGKAGLPLAGFIRNGARRDAGRVGLGQLACPRRFRKPRPGRRNRRFLNRSVCHGR